MIKIIGDVLVEFYMCLGIEELQKWGKLFLGRKENIENFMFYSFICVI